MKVEKRREKNQFWFLKQKHALKEKEKKRKKSFSFEKERAKGHLLDVDLPLSNAKEQFLIVMKKKKREKIEDIFEEIEKILLLFHSCRERLIL